MMAQEYKSRGICVNAIMIPVTKMSKETIKKLHSYWRLFAILQQPFVPKVNVISDAYFSICTSAMYTNVTEKLINHQGQIVKAADKSIPFIKILTSTKVYSPYVDYKEMAKKIWKICNDYN